MELSRRDFLRSTAAFAAVAGVLGTGSIAFAADADENCIVNIAADVPARWERYRYFYRNDVVLYRREGLSGWLWLLAKDSWHTVQVLRDRQGCRAERIKIIWKGFAAGVRFRPQIPYLP